MLLGGLEEEDGGQERHPQCPTAEDGGGNQSDVGLVSC